MVPAGISGRRASVVGEEGLLQALWTRSSSGARFVADVRVYVNCTGQADLAQMRSLAPAEMTIPDLRSLKVAFDSGPSELEISGSPGTLFSVGVRDRADYLITRDDESRLLRFMTYAEPNDTLAVVGEQDTSILISAPLTRYPDGAAARMPRTLQLQINGDDRRLHFGGSPRVARGQPGCRPTTLARATSMAGPMAGWRVVLLPEDAVYVSALVSVRPEPGPGYVRSFDSEFLVSGVTGRFTISGIALDREDRRLGSTDLLSFRGDIKELRVDGNRIETGPNTEILAQGALTAQTRASGDVHVLGTAFALWQAGARLNPTKWERLSPEFQVAGLGFLAALILALLRGLRPVLAQFKRDEPLAWHN